MEIRYIAEDGTPFLTADACLTYEQTIADLNLARSFVHYYDKCYKPQDQFNYTSTSYIVFDEGFTGEMACLLLQDNTNDSLYISDYVDGVNGLYIYDKKREHFYSWRKAMNSLLKIGGKFQQFLP